MSNKLEVQGKTVSDAVSEALLQMGARKDEVNITVLEEPRSGFLGLLGNRPARVLVEKKSGGRSRGKRDYRDQDDDHSAHDLGGGSSGGGSRRGRGSRGRRPGGRSDKQQDARSQNQSTGKGPDRSKGQSYGQPSNQSRNQSRSQSGQRAEGSGSEGREQGNNRNRNRRDQQGRQSQQGRQDRQPQGDRQDRQNQQARPERTQQPRNNREAASVEKDRARNESGSNSGNESRNESRSQDNQSRNRSRRNPRNTRSNQTRPDARTDTRTGARPDARTENNRAPAPKVEIVPDTMIVTGLKGTSYAKPVRGVVENKLDETINSFTTGMLSRAGFPCRCEVTAADYRQVRVITGDDSAGMLIGRHGSTVDAVEHLIDRMMGVAAGERVRLNLDINNYRRRREEVLISRVAEAVARVVETERDYHMEPMCARERRLIHLEAENFSSVRTYTLMRSGDKHVVIALEKGGTEEPVADETSRKPEMISSTEVAIDSSLETPDTSVEQETAESTDPIENNDAKPEDIQPK